jgi:uncharacterized membrane protein YidH (DUF202 family)
VSDAGVPEHLEDQVERTLLAWRRTALSILAAGLLIGHVTAQRTNPAALVVSLLGIGAVVAFVWLRHGVSTAVSGLVLVLGVALLAGVVLVGVLA